MSIPAPEGGKPRRPKPGTPQGVMQVLLLRPVLVEICGGDRGAALLLSQALNFSDGRPGADGWFSATQAEFTAKTGLDRYQQAAARKVLRDRGLVSEERRGAPAALFYCVNLQNLREAVGQLAGDRSEGA